MEVLLLAIYSLVVWFVFIKMKWLPWNIGTQVTVVIIPIVALTALILVLNVVAPSTADVRVLKYVINVVPHDAPDKGDALVRLCQENIAEYAVFVGDDVTDEDAFARTGQCRVLGIRVGRSSTSRAQYYLRTQLEMDELLALLVSLRTAEGGERSAVGGGR